MLYGARTYTNAVDVWSIGCIFAEFFNRSPLFPGTHDIDQLFQVMNVLGTPNGKNWPDVTTLPDFGKIEFEERKPRDWHEVVDASDEAIALLERILVLDPKRRLSVKDVLKHDYFKQIPLPVYHARLHKPPFHRTDKFKFELFDHHKGNH